MGKYIPQGRKYPSVSFGGKYIYIQRGMRKRGEIRKKKKKEER
jgi:hypothetical protein